MNRVLWCLLSLFLVLPVFAGELEDAINSKSDIMLYIKSPTCGYCKKFDPIYTKLQASYNKQYKFVKADITTDYGKYLARQCGASYVPFVILINSSQQFITPIDPECLLNYACMSKTLGSFKK